jgi:hypothetical protein
LIRREVMPLLGISIALVVAFKFKTELLNYVVPTKLLKMEVFSDKEERFIARKLSGLMA